MYTERGVYRPGATVHVNALVRDRKAQRRHPTFPSPWCFEAPGRGRVPPHAAVGIKGLGGHAVDFDLLPTAMRGTWRVSAYSDPESRRHWQSVNSW